MTLNQNLLPPQVNSLSLPPPLNINQEMFVNPNQPTTGTIFLPNGTIINQNVATAAANYTAAYWQSMNLLDPISNAASVQIRPELRSFHPNEFIKENNHNDYCQNWCEGNYLPSNREENRGNQNFHKEPNWRDNYHEEQGWREERDFDRDHVDPKLNRQDRKSVV